jgi:hypothetical protein
MKKVSTTAAMQIKTGQRKLRAERAPDAHQQGRRSVPANALGARSAAHSGTVWRRQRSQTPGAATGRAQRQGPVIAVARKLAVLLHHLWVSGEVYEPLRNSNQTALPAAA